MPDTSTLEMPGQSSSKGGVPSWIMVVGAVAGVAGLVLLLKSGGGGGGTTAAGTSINAALGSIQEENMNLLGTTQAGFMQTNQAISSTAQQTQTQISQGFTQTNEALTSGFLNTQNQIGGLGTQMNAGFSQTYGLIGTLEHDIQGQLSAFSDQTQNNFSQLIAGQGNMTNMLASIQQDVNSGLVGQQQANSMIATIEGLSNANMYIGYANATALTAGPGDSRVVQWLQLAQTTAQSSYAH